VSSLAAVPIEVWLSIGYSLAMVGLAYVIDGFARRAASTHEGGRLSGFAYDERADVFTCRHDQVLRPHSFDPDSKVVSYRAKAATCNACPSKHLCTTSNVGREAQLSVESWPASEAAQFHRRIACAVVVLGLLWPVMLALTGPGPAGFLVLGLGTLTVALVSVPLWSHLWRSTTYMPTGMLLESSDHHTATPSRDALATGPSTAAGKDAR